MIKDIKEGSCTIRGWIDVIRFQGRSTFLIIRDGIGNESKLQIYCGAKLKDITKSLNLESYVEITGMVRKLPEGKQYFKDLEMEAETITVLGSSAEDYPSRCPANANRELKIDERHLYIRNNEFALITKLRSLLVKAIRVYFDNSQCTEIFPPCFVGNQCEGGSTLFKLNYPAKEKGEITAYLTQSSQFYLEYLLPGIGDCYCIYPSFRAEKSHTRRHLTEFLHAECEWANVDTMEIHISKLKSLLKGVLFIFFEYGKQDLQQLGLKERVENLLKMCDDIVILTHKEAIDYCKEHEIYKDPEIKLHFNYDDDIPEMQERQMIDKINKIVFLVKFPKWFKSFYFKLYDDETVYGCDVEVPGVGEIIGSGVREHDYEKLLRAIHEHELNPDDYREYLELRKYGSARTSGMGLGVDRFLTWLLDLPNIRDVVTFPRVPGRLFP